MSTLRLNISFILDYLFTFFYAFSRRFYPKRLHSAFRLYIVLSVCVFPGNRTHNLCTANSNALPLSHRNTICYMKVSE